MCVFSVQSARFCPDASMAHPPAYSLPFSYGPFPFCSVLSITALEALSEQLEAIQLLMFTFYISKVSRFTPESACRVDLKPMFSTHLHRDEPNISAAFYAHSWHNNRKNPFYMPGEAKYATCS